MHSKDKERFVHKVILSALDGVQKGLNEYFSNVPNKENDDYDEIDYIFDLKDLFPSNDILTAESIFPIRLRASGVMNAGPFINDGTKIKPLQESVTRTYSYKELIDHFRAELGVSPGFIKAEITVNNVETIMLFVETADNINFAKQAMEQFGWSYSHSKHCMYKGVPIIAIAFDPMFQTPINNEIKTNPILFHWTPKYLYPTIQNDGLKPKSENAKFSFPPKIHVMMGTISETHRDILGESLCKQNKDPRNNGEYVLLNIDTTKIPYDIDFFYDPRYEYGYYTKQNINKEAIFKNLEMTFTFDK